MLLAAVAADLAQQAPQTRHVVTSQGIVWRSSYARVRSTQRKRLWSE